MRLKPSFLFSLLFIFSLAFIPLVSSAQFGEDDEDSVIVEEEEEVFEEEEVGEHFDYDDSITFYVDSLYQSLRLSENFHFDSSLIPASNLYSIWDTVVINPYREDLSKMQGSFFIPLQDGGDDCYFYPPCIGPITSNFGPRRWGRRTKFHYGVDLNLETGDPVYAAFDGVIRIAKLSYDYGYMVLIRHYNGIETLYAHFSRLMVYTGQTVRAGDIIGLGGSTGRSTGSHLHFEIRFMGEKIDPGRLICFPENRLYTDTVVIDKSYFGHLSSKAKHTKGRGKFHVVRRGDTLAHIGYKYGTTVNRLCQLNRISRRTILRPGRRLRVR